MKLQGSEHLTREKVEHHLTNLETIFDETASVSRTPFFFSSDITGKLYSGSLRRLHGATRSLRQMLVEISENHWLPLSAIFFQTLALQILNKAQEVIAFLPYVWGTAEAIMSANPGIIDQNKDQACRQNSGHVFSSKSLLRAILIR